MRSFHHCGSECARLHTCHLFEDAGEVALIRKAGCQCNGGQLRLRIKKLLTGELHLQTSHVFADTDGSSLTPLSDIKSFFARFSPDGKKIAFISGKFPTSEIFIADADGRNQTILISGV
jgi:Tol biopolymer transport system component